MSIPATVPDMPPTIIFLSGHSMNDALRAAGRAHEALFRELGRDFVEVNLSEPGATPRLAQVMQERPVEFAYSVMGMGADIGGKRPTAPT